MQMDIDCQQKQSGSMQQEVEVNQRIISMLEVIILMKLLIIILMLQNHITVQDADYLKGQILQRLQ